MTQTSSNDTLLIPALASVLLCLAACGAGPADQVETGQQAHTFERGGARLNYLLFLPESYGQDSGQRWPLIIASPFSAA